MRLDEIKEHSTQVLHDYRPDRSRSSKELSLCHKLKVSNLHISLQPDCVNFDISNLDRNHILKYLRSITLG